MKRILAGLAAVALASCGSGGSGDQTTGDLPGGPLVDLDPAADVVRVSLVAEVAQVELVPGRKAQVWAYRDAGRPGARATVPGPLLEANVGDEVVVDFRNDLPVKTTIHWHGVRVANPADGSSLTQEPIAPGASYQYRFHVRDAGSFWFHPHLDSALQIEMGLYAPLVVRGPEAIDVSAERYLVLDDVKLTADGRLDPMTTPLDIMAGRQGNTLLVNGTSAARIDARRGTRERWRIVNAANGRFFDLELPGHRFVVIGGDGGMLPSPYETERLLVTPGERYDVLVTPRGDPGATIALRTVHHDRGHELPDPGPLDILRIQLSEDEGTDGAPPKTTGAFDPIDVSAAPVRKLVLSEAQGHHAAEFFINGERWPDVTPIEVQAGTVEIWEVENAAEMDHPFHLHGFYFQVLDAQGGADARRGWKDTVNVPRTSTLRLAVRLDAPGHWMYHCHILEHADNGMMGMLEVMP